MAQPDITVIVPIYNVEDYLEKCLNSLSKQNYPSFCVLLINDGSTDRSGDIACAFAEKDERFYYYEKSNGGLSDARNFGLSMVTTKYVAFVDSDDYVSDEFLAQFMEAFDKFKTDIVICNIQLVAEDGQLLSARDHHFQGIHSGLSIAIENISCGSILSMVQNKAFKTSLFTNIEFPFGLFYEDRATTYKLLLKSAAISFVQGRNYYYLQRRGSISQNFDQKRFNDRILVITDMRKYLNANYGNIDTLYVDYSAALNINVSGLIQFSRFSKFSPNFFRVFSVRREPFKFNVFSYMLKRRPIKSVVYVMSIFSPLVVYFLIRLYVRVTK